MSKFDNVYKKLLKEDIDYSKIFQFQNSDYDLFGIVEANNEEDALEQIKIACEYDDDPTIDNRAFETMIIEKLNLTSQIGNVIFLKTKLTVM